jgi:hypothetical protein
MKIKQEYILRGVLFFFIVFFIGTTLFYRNASHVYRQRSEEYYLRQDSLEAMNLHLLRRIRTLRDSIQVSHRRLIRNMQRIQQNKSSL